MAYIYFNSNPKGNKVGDCAVRAVSKAIGKDWEDAYIGLCSDGLLYGDMPSSNYVWGMYLRKFGFTQKIIPSICPQCISVSRFADEHPVGRYVLACQSHVVTVIDGNYFDTWDSGDEIVLYFYEQEE